MQNIFPDSLNLQMVCITATLRRKKQFSLFVTSDIDETLHFDKNLS